MTEPGMLTTRQLIAYLIFAALLWGPVIWLIAAAIDRGF